MKGHFGKAVDSRGRGSGGPFPFMVARTRHTSYDGAGVSVGAWILDAKRASTGDL